MHRSKVQYLLVLSLTSYCYCELGKVLENKLVNGFIDFYNSQPGQLYSCDEGYLQNAQRSVTTSGDQFKAVVPNKSRTKRQGILGGQSEQDPSKPEYKALAEESMQKYLATRGNTNPHKVVDVTHVTTQVVSGIITRIDFIISPVDGFTGDVKSCHSEIWEQDWLNKKKIKVNCGIENNYRAKRQQVGGQTLQDPRKPEYKALAEESMQKYLATRGNTNPHKVVDVTHVTTQVVSGIITRIDFIISPVDGFTGDVKSCHSEIWEQDWLNKKEIKVNCGIENNSRAKRQQVGGQTLQDPRKPEYKALAQESMQKYLATRGNTNPHKVVDVTHVTTQVVSGIITRIDFIISPVDGFTGDVKSCHSEIWEQDWLNKKEIKVNCGIENNYRVKRQQVGGQTFQDPCKPEYKALAEESMQKYLATRGNTNPHKVDRVTRVTTQVVSGIITRIDFIISPVDVFTGGVKSCHSEIWEQDWLNKKEIKVNCGIENNSRAKRQQVGGQTLQDPRKPEYKALAQESMQKYLATRGNTNPHKVVDVTHVTTQVVSGIITRIDFIISPVDGFTGDVKSCHSEIWEQDWLNKKEIKVNCGIENNSRAKRQQVGGQTLQDPRKPEYKALAEESMQKYLATRGNTNPHKVVDVTHVTTQVVSGIITRIDFIISPVDVFTGGVKSCHSEIWEQDWLNKKEIKVNCGIENNSRAKRQQVGGQTLQDPRKPEYKALAQESMQKYLATRGNTNPHKVVDVTHVTTQVVSGIITRIDFIISPVDVFTGGVKSCHSEIWEQDWLNKKEIKVNCGIENNSRAKRQQVGGQTLQDPRKPEYKALAEESMQKYLATRGNTNPHKVVDVTHVTTQVVSGIITRIDFIISPVDVFTGGVKSCHSEIWEQDWLNKKEIKVNCGIENNYRAKRQQVGGQTLQDPRKPEYKALAQESMQKYLATRGNTNPHKVVDVTHVTTQVVSGIITRIDFIISPVDGFTGDVKSCHSEIWEQDWLNKKEIKVNCGIENNSRAKRQQVGGQTLQDPRKPEYKALAEESMQKYLATRGNTNPHKVVDVTHVTTQVVSGIITRIDFIISPVDVFTGGVKSCHSEIWEQDWLNKKEIKVNCGIENNSRAKRQQVGGQTLQDPRKPEYKALAEESMQKYLATRGNTNPHKVVDVTHVTTQVVSGIITRIDFIISPVDVFTGGVKSCHSEIWEQDWLNKKEIKVNCGIENNYRAKRQQVGGQTLQDPRKPEYKALAQESMQKYLATRGNTNPHKVVDVTHVTTQVVSGIITRIDFIISPVDVFTGGVKSCHSEIWEQDWLHKKEIKVNCGIENNSRAKRQQVRGQTLQDPRKPEYKALAQESMQKYLATRGNTNPHKVVDVTHVTTQVVSGIITRIDFIISPVDVFTGGVKSCHSEIWEQDWLNKKEIKVNCGIENNYRAKRQQVGGQTLQDPRKPEYKALAQESMQKYLATRGNTNPHKVVDVTHVTTQVVSGIITRIDFIISPVDVFTGGVKSCHSEIWEQDWLHKKEIKVNCGIENNSRAKRQQVGGQTLQDPRKPEYKALAKESMQKYLAPRGITGLYKVDRVTRVTTQVVSGIITRIDFKISPVGEASGPVRNCHSEISEQPWLNKKDIKVNCGIENNSKAKRQQVGGQTLQDPRKPEYKALAKESMQKYLAPRGSIGLYKVDRVTRVTTQVLSGIITRIDFKISPVGGASGSVRKCHSEISEQPWLNKKDIKVNCGNAYD